MQRRSLRDFLLYVGDGMKNEENVHILTAPGDVARLLEIMNFKAVQGGGDVT